MKDFACQASSKKKKKSLSVCIKNGFAFIKKIFRLGIGLVASLTLLAVITWLIFPHFLAPHNNINIVFTNINKDSQEREFLFASFDFDTNKIQVFVIDDKHETLLIDSESQTMQQVNFYDAVNEIGVEQLTTQHLSWLTGRVVSRVVFLEVPHAKIKNLPQTVNSRLVKILSNLNLTKVDEIKELFYFSNLFRRGEYQFVESSAVLPSTSVLPTNCSMAVINTTKISGYASVITSILENSGARIIRLDSGYRDQEFTQTAVAVSQEKTECSEALSLINENLFFGNLLLLDEEISGSLLNRFRADIVILLSDDQDFLSWIQH